MIDQPVVLEICLLRFLYKLVNKEADLQVSSIPGGNHFWETMRLLAVFLDDSFVFHKFRICLLLKLVSSGSLFDTFGMLEE